MAIPESRAAFIAQPHRTETASDSAVKTAYPQSAPIEINTNLNAADAASLATTILNATKTHPLVFRVGVEAVYAPEDFASNAFTVILDAPLYSTDGRTSKVVGAEVDWLSGKSTIEVRG